MLVEVTDSDDYWGVLEGLLGVFFLESSLGLLPLFLRNEGHEFGNFSLNTLRIHY